MSYSFNGCDQTPNKYQLMEIGFILAQVRDTVPSWREPWCWVGATYQLQLQWNMEQHLKKGECPGSFCCPLFFIQTGPEPTGMCHPHSGQVFPQFFKDTNSPNVLHCCSVLFLQCVFACLYTHMCKGQTLKLMPPPVPALSPSFFEPSLSPGA